VETGDRQTEDVGGDTRNDHNVVRLPRDWLGPREELVPVGPAAGPVAPWGDDALPPTAEAFWSEDSAALHGAVQAPTAQPASPSSSPAPLSSHKPPSRPAWRSRTRRLSIPRRPAHPLRLSARWALLTLPVGALLIMALIGITENPTSQRANRRSASAPASAPKQAVARATGATVAGKTPKPGATRQTGQKGVTPARRRHSGRIGAALQRQRRLRSRATHRTGSPQRGAPGSSPAPTSVSPPASTYVTTPTGSSATSGGSAGPSTATPSTGVGSSTSHPAKPTATSATRTPFGENGTLGPGSSPDS
jgi:hypothetical protein